MWDRVWFLYIARRYDDALEAVAAAKRVSAPEHAYEALIYQALGNDNAAFGAWIARARQRGLPEAQAQAIEVQANNNGARAAMMTLARTEYGEHAIPYAALQAMLGEQEAAVETLLNDKPREKSWWWSWYAVNPAFDTIRDDPRLAGKVRVAG